MTERRRARQTWLDRAISWVAPTAGLNRAVARNMIQVLAYEAGRVDRRTEGWVATSTSADVEIAQGMGRLRNRARSLVRDNPYAARAIEIRAAHTIGTGITAEVSSKRLRPVWEDWIAGLDLDGGDLAGLLWTAERCRMESGEALIRIVRTGRMGELPIPTQLQVLEPDYLDDTRDTLGTPNGRGNTIRHGIEFDEVGRVVGYWLFREHPGEAFGASLQLPRGLASEFVPAEDVIHVYRRLRAGQRRGVTDFAPVMLRLRDLDDYDDAQLVRKKVEACLTAFVTSPQGAEAKRLAPTSSDDKGRLESFSPGLIEYGLPGESISFLDPRPSGDYADFKRFGARDIGAGVGVPYELMTGDLSQVNYSSARVGQVDFRRRVETDQWLLWVPRVCQRIAARFRRDVMQLRPNMGARDVMFDWTPPRFELLDPQRETAGELDQVLAGFETWDEIVRRHGWSAEEQLDNIERFQKELERRGIVLKSDHRNPSSGGGTQAGAEPPPSPGGGGDDEEEEEQAA